MIVDLPSAKLRRQLPDPGAASPAQDVLTVLPHHVMVVTLSRQHFIVAVIWQGWVQITKKDGLKSFHKENIFDEYA